MRRPRAHPRPATARPGHQPHPAAVRPAVQSCRMAVQCVPSDRRISLAVPSSDLTPTLLVSTGVMQGQSACCSSRGRRAARAAPQSCLTSTAISSRPSLRCQLAAVGPCSRQQHVYANEKMPHESAMWRMRGDSGYCEASHAVVLSCGCFNTAAGRRHGAGDGEGAMGG